MKLKIDTFVLFTCGCLLTFFLAFKSFSDADASDKAATTQPMTQELQDIIDVSRDFSKYIDDAVKIKNQTEPTQNVDSTILLGSNTQNSILIFASNSLQKQGLQELFENAAIHPNATVIFRGIEKGMPLLDGVGKLQKLATQHNPAPNVIINPMLFEKYNITVVPTIVMLEGNAAESQRVLSSVQGLMDPSWLLQSTQSGRTGDHGVQGDVRNISEPDLVKIMQAKVASIDWEQKKKDAIKRCWNNLPSHQLLAVEKNRIRRIDPTITVTKDIIAKDAQVIAKAGTTINPLKLRSFTQILAIFDPENPQHLVVIKNKLPHIKQAARTEKVVYIATNFCPYKGAAGYQKICNTVNAPVFLLTKDILERFELTHAPALVYANQDYFIVEELDASKNRNNACGDIVVNTVPIIGANANY